MGKVFANVPGDQGSIPDRVIPKTQKIVLNDTFLNTKHHKVWIKSMWKNPGKGVVPSPTPNVVAIEKGVFWSPSTLVANFTYIYIYIYAYTYIQTLA